MQDTLHGIAHRKRERGKRDGSLAFTLDANEARYEGGEQKSTVQQSSEHVGQLYIEAAAVENQKKEPVDTDEQVTVDT